MDLIETNNGLKKELFRLAVLTIGASISAFNIDSFVTTGGLYPGGFAGVTILIQRVAQMFFQISIPYTAI
ncbi:MAG TPA: YitT family protein, partial [Anaerovoracaceae bacterium]|nr:YitT family protein [Anaerovoracaceae bacterium]